MHMHGHKLACEHEYYTLHVRTSYIPGLFSLSSIPGLMLIRITTADKQIYKLVEVL